MILTKLLSDSRRSAILIGLCFAILLILPWLHLMPETSPFHLSAYWITLIGKIMALAMVALALDLVWGYAGILSLGHGLYFALGGYAFGMYLTRETAGNGLPDFMRFLSWTEMPWYWAGTQHFLVGSSISSLSTRTDCLYLWFFCLSLQDQRRIFLHHHPSNGICCSVAILP